jgi:hypothetical protein
MSSKTKDEKKLIRLISAYADIKNSIRAGEVLMSGIPDEILEDVFLSFVVSYGRPFTENYGVGNIIADYPNYPTFGDSEMSLRHSRMMDLRNKFLAHSSAEGTRIFVIPANALPLRGGTIESYLRLDIAKRVFAEPEYVKWLLELPKGFYLQLQTDIKDQLSKTFGSVTETFELATGHENFQWK